MRDFIKPALWFAFFFAIGLTIVHDLGAPISNQLRVQDVAQRTVEEGIAEWMREDKNEIAAAKAAQDYAERNGAKVYGWEMENQKLTVWVEMRAYKDRTWIAGRLWSDYETATLARSQFTDSLR
jgi:phage terminase Nu1 subunit (DNA packaging protein)